MKISLYLSIFALSLLTSCALFTPVSDSGSAPSSVKGEGKQRQVAVDMAVSLKGTKYKKAGSKPSTGFDCSGFTSYVLNRSGVEVPRTSRDQESAAQLKKLSHLKPGDLVFFRSNKKSSVFHVAMVVENSKDGLVVAHSTSSRGVIVENINKSSYWTKKYWTGGSPY